MSVYKEILKDTFSGEKVNREIRIKQIKLEIGKLTARMDSIEDKFLDDLIEPATYKSMKGKTQKSINDLKSELENLKAMDKDLEEYLKLGISFLNGVDKLYKNSPSDIKKKIVGSIFPEKLIFSEKNYRTAFINEFIALILSKHKPFRLLKIKTPRHFGEESRKAPPLGLEPRTL